MKLVKSLLATAALVASVGAGAQVTGSLGGGTGSFLALSSPQACTAASMCTLTSGATTVARITGGQTYAVDQQFADLPSGNGNAASGNFLTSGPSSGNPQGTNAVLLFTTAVDYVSFLWGSPDLYNVLTVFTQGGGSQTFVAGPSSANSGATSLGFSTTNGSQTFSQYVQFLATGSNLITGLTFSNNPSVDAFETANFSIVRVVPEPETYALMLAGLGALGFIARRRKRV